MMYRGQAAHFHPDTDRPPRRDDGPSDAGPSRGPEDTTGSPTRDAPTLASPARGLQGSPAPQRADGAVELGFALRAGTTRLVHLYQSHPCRAFFPNMGTRGEPPLAVLANLAGGTAGGDRIRIEVGVGAGAALSVTTQAAEKVHRCDGGPDTLVEAGVPVAEDAWLDWLPRPSILFDGARLRRRTAVSLAPGGRLLACDTFIFGRRARGERFAHGSLRDRWSVTIGGASNASVRRFGRR